MLKIAYRSVFFLLLVGLTINSLAQTRDIFWHFGGNSNSIEFTNPDMTPQRITLPNNLGTGGGAVASDYLNGELLFYTDGINVYASDDSQIATVNGSTTRNQSAAVALNPADADNSEYYLFTIDNGGQIRYHVYDKDLFRNTAFPLPADGDMDAGQLNVIDPNLPATTLSEGMIIIANQDRDGFWLITHEQGTNNYNVTTIDDTGFTNTVIALAGTPTDVANFSYSPANDQIAVAPADPAENISILDIDLETGTLSLSGVDLSIVSNNIVYDTEWSSSGDYLYASGDIGGNQNIYRIDLTQTPVVVENVLTNGIVNSFGIKYGADTAIYHLYENNAGDFIVGRIEAPNIEDINQILYNPDVFNNENFAARQFPAFLPPYNLLNLNFTFSGTCANAPTYFFPQVSPDYEFIEWDFEDDGNFVPLSGGSYTYEMADDYEVTMRVSLGGAIEEETKTITIEDFDLTLQIDPQQQYWCPDDFGDRMNPATSIVTYTATAQGDNANGATIRWSNQTPAEANATTTFVEPGTYYVVATDPNTGCETYLEQQVFEYGVQNNFAFVWYFGDNAGLDFNPLFDMNDPDFPSVQPIGFGGAEFNGGNNMTTPEGCAVYCDANGDPLLYSDGMEVYNKAGTQLTADLGGNENAAQSIFITQNPTDGTQYFLFFTQEVPNIGNAYAFRYAVFDLKMLDGDGDLIRENDDPTSDPIITTLYNNSTERITGNANWVITHEYGNDIFRAYPLNGQGIGNPVFSNVGEPHLTTNTSGQGYMKLAGDKLAVALSLSPSENLVDYFNFDVATGAVTHVTTLDTEETGQVYGVEFSPATNNLYASIIGPDNKIIAWEVDNTMAGDDPPDIQEIIDSRTEIVSDGTVTFGALQQGPQGSIYIAKDGATTLASINNPDDIAAPDFTITSGDFPNVGAGGFSRLGLPNFVDFNGSATPAPSLSVGNGCENDQLTITLLNPIQDDFRIVESYVVQILDENNMQVGSAVSLDFDNTTFTTTIPTAGNYRAILFIFDECTNPSIPPNEQEYPFTINPNPTIGTITTTSPSTCGGNDGSAEISFTSTGDLNYSIAGPISIPQRTSTGPSIETVQNLSAGFYTVTVNQTFTTGTCSVVSTFVINDPVPYALVAAEASPADCNGENGEASFSFGGSGAPPTTYTWELRLQANDLIVDNGDQASQNSSAIDAGNYYFRVSDNNNCLTSDFVTITTPNDLSLTIGNISPSCDAQPILIDITTDASQLVTVNEFTNGTVGDEITNYDIIGNNDSIRITPPSQGVNRSIEYVVVAPGDIDGPCTATEVIGVSFGESDPNPYEPAYSFCGFEEDDSKQFVFLDNSPEGFTSVVWFDDAGNQITGGNDYTFIGSDTLRVSVQGMITAELTNVFGCVTTAEINIIEDCEARVNAPNAFTPNGDSNNDTWTIFPFLVASDEFEIFIYNRWGELVFQSNDLNFMVNEGWNGGYDNDLGRPLQQGTYAYKVQFKSSFDENPETQERRGGITLIR